MSKPFNTLTWYRVCHGFRHNMIILKSLFTTFEESIIFEAAGKVAKFGSNPKPNYFLLLSRVSKLSLSLFVMTRTLLLVFKWGAKLRYPQIEWCLDHFMYNVKTNALRKMEFSKLFVFESFGIVRLSKFAIFFGNIRFFNSQKFCENSLEISLG